MDRAGKKKGCPRASFSAFFVKKLLLDFFFFLFASGSCFFSFLFFYCGLFRFVSFFASNKASAESESKDGYEDQSKNSFHAMYSFCLCYKFLCIICIMPLKINKKIKNLKILILIKEIQNSFILDDFQDIYDKKIYAVNIFY